MKTILKEWRKNKEASVLLMIYAIAKIAYLIINARIVVLLAEAIDDLDRLPYHLIRIGVYCLINILLNPVISEASMSRHKIYTSMCRSFTTKILDADYEMFTKLSCSAINTTFNDLWMVSNAGRLIVELAMEVANAVIILVNIYLIYPEMIVPIFTIYAVCTVICRILFTKFEKMDREIDDKKRSLNQEIHEIIDGFAEVRGFCAQRHHYDSQLRKDEDVVKGFAKRTRIISMINVLVESIDTVAVLITILFIAKGISSNTITMALGMSLIMYVWRLVNPIMGSLNYLDELSQYLTVVHRYEEVMNYKNSQKNETINLNSFNDSIEIKNLSFRYNDSDTVLENVNMLIRKGEKIGICGSSGGGKTTLIKLLEKFYDPTSGSILIDGLDMKAFSSSSIRKKMGIVHQDPHIFSDTIYNNIIYGNWKCSEYEVIEACKKANLYEFIESLPEKFQTQVGPRGLKLSGGQKQRIALARIFLLNPEIILLDEATSALDNESETLIQDALDGFHNKTIITVAHRLSTIRNSDKIYVMENHTVVESGTHEELINAGGRYLSLLKPKK